MLKHYSVLGDGHPSQSATDSPCLVHDDIVDATSPIHDPIDSASSSPSLADDAIVGATSPIHDPTDSASSPHFHPAEVVFNPPTNDHIHNLVFARPLGIVRTPAKNAGIYLSIFSEFTRPVTDFYRK